MSSIRLSISRTCPKELSHPRGTSGWSTSTFTPLHVLAKTKYVDEETTNCELLLARCRYSGIQVVLKTIHNKSKLSEMRLAQLNREALIHLSLVHPAILKMYAAFETQDSIVFVLEYCSRGDLHAYLSMYGSVPEKRAVLEFIIPLISALNYCHRRGIIHRDIKPENVFIAADGTIRLADFGLSVNTLHEKAVTRLGTLAFAPPEVLSGISKSDPHEGKDRNIGYGPSADVYSLGVLLYELMAGGPRGTNMSSKHGPAMAKFIVNTLHSPACCRVSPEAADLITHCLALDPIERPSCGELLHHPLILKYNPTGLDLALAVGSPRRPTADSLPGHQHQLQDERNGQAEALMTVARRSAPPGATAGAAALPVYSTGPDFKHAQDDSYKFPALADPTAASKQGMILEGLRRSLKQIKADSPKVSPRFQVDSSGASSGPGSAQHTPQSEGRAAPWTEEEVADGLALAAIDSDSPRLPPVRPDANAGRVVLPTKFRVSLPTPTVLKKKHPHEINLNSATPPKAQLHVIVGNMRGMSRRASVETGPPPSDLSGTSAPEPPHFVYMRKSTSPTRPPVTESEAPPTHEYKTPPGPSASIAADGPGSSFVPSASSTLPQHTQLPAKQVGPAPQSMHVRKLETAVMERLIHQKAFAPQH